MNNFFINRKESIAIALAGLASVLLVAGVVYSSTIGTDISTGGTLTVTGVSTLSGLSTFAGFISTASSTVIGGLNTDTLSATGLSTLTGFVSNASSTAVIANASTLSVTGLSTLTGFVSNASSTAVIANASTLSVTGLSTFGTAGGFVSQASSTVVGTLHVGAGSDISAMVMGMCFLKNATIAASSTGYADCTATGVLANDRVFVQATSSLESRFIIQSASSTTNGLINVQVYNHGSPNATNINLMATGSLNFWAVR